VDRIIEDRTVVWIVNDSGQKDFSSARHFGVLQPITKGNINPFDPARLWRQVQTSLEDFKPGDYLLLVGHNIVNALAIIAALRKAEGQLQLLVFGANREDYRIVTLEEYWKEEGI